jgi:hypothetical protein
LPELRTRTVNQGLASPVADGDPVRHRTDSLSAPCPGRDSLPGVSLVPFAAAIR